MSIGWLEPGDPFRKITFLIALGMIMGAAIVDMSLILLRGLAARAGRSRAEPAVAAGGLEAHRTPRCLVAWVVFWGVGDRRSSASRCCSQPVGYLG